MVVLCVLTCALADGCVVRANVRARSATSDEANVPRDSASGDEVSVSRGSATKRQSQCVKR